MDYFLKNTSIFFLQAPKFPISKLHQITQLSISTCVSLLLLYLQNLTLPPQKFQTFYPTTNSHQSKFNNSFFFQKPGISPYSKFRISCTKKREETRWPFRFRLFHFFSFTLPPPPLSRFISITAKERFCPAP